MLRAGVEDPPVEPRPEWTPYRAARPVDAETARGWMGDDGDAVPGGFSPQDPVVRGGISLLGMRLRKQLEAHGQRDQAANTPQERMLDDLLELRKQLRSVGAVRRQLAASAPGAERRMAQVARYNLQRIAGLGAQVLDGEHGMSEFNDDDGLKEKLRAMQRSVEEQPEGSGYSTWSAQYADHVDVLASLEALTQKPEVMNKAKKEAHNARSGRVLKEGFAAGHRSTFENLHNGVSEIWAGPDARRRLRRDAQADGNVRQQREADSPRGRGRDARGDLERAGAGVPPGDPQAARGPRAGTPGDRKRRRAGGGGTQGASEAHGDHQRAGVRRVGAGEGRDTGAAGGALPPGDGGNAGGPAHAAGTRHPGPAGGEGPDHGDPVAQAAGQGLRGRGRPGGRHQEDHRRRQARRPPGEGAGGRRAPAGAVRQVRGGAGHPAPQGRHVRPRGGAGARRHRGGAHGLRGARPRGAGDRGPEARARWRGTRRPGSPSRATTRGTRRCAG